MRQRKRLTRKAQLREERQAKRNAIPFEGTCSNCRDKKVMVVKVKNAQICTNKCLPNSIRRQGGVVVETPTDKAITAGA